ncbi:S66 peptidase family protein [Symbioplanes lichenis]|uniref:S66 peptidase family protein n=1 Tax=Symbioplanes lichenis TaxID=1629072 RepID=UPI002738BCEC|nr:LD-carboxypeptidase [Actinoplanes lichenis]
MIDLAPVRPAVLRPGDLVTLVAPSGAMQPERAAAAERVLTSWGLRVRLGAHALSRWTFLAGTDEQRLADLNDAFRDPEVRGILCLRGGYGAQRIVDDLDFAAVRADPKLVLGFSDITALHVALWCEARLVTVHGATVGLLDRGAGTATAHSLRSALMTSAPTVLVADPTEDTFPVRSAGRAEGVLLGGNLAVLAATAGSKHKPDLTGAILVLEDVNEVPYKLDRLLVQLHRAGWLDGLAGVALGQFTGCGPAEAVQQVFAERLLPLGVPVLGGLAVGHGMEQQSFALGLPAVLDADEGTLTVPPVNT